MLNDGRLQAVGAKESVLPNRRGHDRAEPAAGCASVARSQEA